MPDFQVGDYVEVLKGSGYFITNGGQRGTIRQISGNATYLTWDPENKDYFNSRAASLESASRWSINSNHLKLVTPAIPDGLTPVQRKCKKLWNESKYVQKYPAQGYQ